MKTYDMIRYSHMMRLLLFWTLPLLCFFPPSSPILFIFRPETSRSFPKMCCNKCGCECWIELAVEQISSDSADSSFSFLFPHCIIAYPLPPFLTIQPHTPPSTGNPTPTRHYPLTLSIPARLQKKTAFPRSYLSPIPLSSSSSSSLMVD